MRKACAFLVAVALLSASAARAADSQAARSQAPGADLRLSMVDAPDPARLDELHVHHHGDERRARPGSRREGELHDPELWIDGGALRPPNPFVQGIAAPGSQDVTTSQGTCQLSGTFLFLSAVSCDLGSLASGSVATITVRVLATLSPVQPGRLGGSHKRGSDRGRHRDSDG
jgi:hypothetical protein